MFAARAIPSRRAGRVLVVDVASPLSDSRQRVIRGVERQRRNGRVVCAGLALALTLGGACRTTSSASPAGERDVSVTRSKATRVWEVLQDGASIGLVTRYDSDEVPSRTFFLVKNPARQDLGMVDALGRAWRYRPHEREAEWLTTGTVLHGALAILGREGSGELRELDASAASAR